MNTVKNLLKGQSVDTKIQVDKAKLKKDRFDKQYLRRLKFLSVLLLIALFVLIGRLIHLQLLSSEDLKNKALMMRRQSNVHTYRGEITDRNGLVLASDVTMYDIYSHPNYYDEKTPAYINDMAGKLSPYLHLPKATLVSKLSKFNYNTITLARKVDKRVVDNIRKLNIAGLDYAKVSVRRYPQGILASHIIGYVNPDAEVSAGVENTGKKHMDHVVDMPDVEIDGTGSIIYKKDTKADLVTSPPLGEVLRLTIDAKLQHLCETELKKTIDKFHAERGAVVMLNPKNGELYAFAVYPSYDPNNYKKINPAIVKNWAITDVYPPGSTFKILTLASALETGVIDKNSTINDTGQITIQGWTIQNYDYGKHGAPGMIDLEYLLEHSSNIASAKLSLMMKSVEHRNLLIKFGIGSKTGIDIPGESSGIIKPLNEWDKVTRATIGFGYGIASTPIQMAAAVTAIANDGVWITPHLIKYPDNVKNSKIKKRRVLKVETARTVKDLLKESVFKSKSEAGKIPGYYIAGKTGTSRKPNPNGAGYIAGAVFTSFAGFLPAEDPELLIMVVVDNPKGAEIWGSTVAGPLFNSIAAEAARYLNLKKDRPEEKGLVVSR